MVDNIRACLYIMSSQAFYVITEYITSSYLCQNDRISPHFYISSLNSKFSIRFISLYSIYAQDNDNVFYVKIIPLFFDLKNLQNKRKALILMFIGCHGLQPLGIFMGVQYLLLSFSPKLYQYLYKTGDISFSKSIR